MAFVSAFSLLLASFPARNSDLWLHLAAGRQIAEGSFSFDVNFDVNGSATWLYDFLCYAAYSAVGGSGLVFIKVLAVGALAVVLLHISRCGSGLRISVACNVLAVLAMSTRLLLQPSTFSYLFLALTLWLLRANGNSWVARTEHDAKGVGSAARPSKTQSVPPSRLPLGVLWPLVFLFVIWVNFDSWFILGLAVVAVVSLGGFVDCVYRRRGTLSSPEQGVVPPAKDVPVLLGPLVLAVTCLLNPRHVHAFLPPAELGWLAAEPVSRAITSPFQAAYFANFGWSPAAMAYFPLLALGLLSFLVNWPRWRWQRFLPWVGLALLSAFEVRTIPFFAVVGGPVLAWNLHEAVHRRQSAAARPIGRFGRYGLIFAAICLLFLAWPGWLQGPPFEPRRWAIDNPGSLARGAAAVQRWHHENKLGPHQRGLHFSLESSNTFAWFCPEDKGLFDRRLTSDILARSGARESWHQRMRSLNVHHLIVYHPERGRLFTALDRLFSDPTQWPLLHIEGDLAVFGWRDPSRVRGPDPFGGWELDVDHLAFGPASDKKAPRRRPDREPQMRRWWHAFWKPMPSQPVESAEAKLRMVHAEAIWRTAPARHHAAWQASQSAALVAATVLGGASGAWSPSRSLSDAYIRLVFLAPMLPKPGSALDTVPALDRLALDFRRGFSWQRDDTPPALFYLAIRAARRALALNPDDAQAQLILGESYMRLLDSTRERAWSQRLRELAALRRVQASVALNQAVALKPQFAQAHFSLGALYQEMGFLDLALHHQQTYLELRLRAGAAAGVSEEQFHAEHDYAAQAISRLAQLVEDREKSFADAASGMSVLDRAMLAVEKGLVGRGRDLLLESDIAAFGRQGMILELELLLKTGRARDVREWTAAEHRTELGPPLYHWLRAQALAASGDYALAEGELTQLAAGDGSERTAAREIATVIGQSMFDLSPTGDLLPQALKRARCQIELAMRVAALARDMEHAADATVLRGLLAMEEGEIAEAKSAFRAALGVRTDETAVAGGLDFDARTIAQSWLQALARATSETRD